MPFEKGCTRSPNAGWTPESKEKRRKIHEIFDEVFDEVGGKDRLVQWVKASDDNYRDFIKIMSKRIPQAVEVSGSDKNIRVRRLLKIKKK